MGSKVEKVKKQFNKIFRKKFVKNVLTLAAGTTMAQIIIILFAPIITRLYGPEAFGILGVFLSIIAIISPIAALTYPLAIVLPKEDKDAKQLIKLSIYISLVTASLMSIVFLFMGDFFTNMLNSQSITPYLQLIPLVMVLSVTLEVTIQWLIRKKLFSIQAKAVVAQALIVNATKTGFGFISPFATTLIWISTIGYALHNILIIRGLKKYKVLKEPSRVSNSTLKIGQVAKKYRDFPQYRSPQTFISAVSKNLPVIMLTTLFSPAAAGFYAIGQRVLKMPSTLIGKAISDVFFPRMSEAVNNKENVTRLLIMGTLSMGAIGIIPFGIIMIFGPQLFSVVFGEEWVQAGEYARWMSLWLLFTFVTKPSRQTLPVLFAQKLSLIESIVSLMLRITGLFVGSYLFNDDLLAIALYSVAGSSTNIVLVILTIIKTKRLSNSFIKGTERYYS
ncbi:lipopolysaccharide biosynthesis protein [Evansella halocellulosilytica]|uniref:lipopolysaccharide biosynthesis protein n=1 Tax=Evansella halocellulosilytica TaxID=2011013 RepID=UPI000BB71193|nr:lipopolysaccharide biosynthesis protein [Evansella halocellulosilytica]